VGFSDIQNHWAKKEIQILMKENVINGYGDNTFRPNNNITVSEFLKILIEMADYKLITEGSIWPDWYIATAKYNNFISENQFQEYSSPITRGEAAQVIANYINLKNVPKALNKFTDLDNDEKESILKLVELNIINGYSDNTFRSERPITRAEACKIILKAYEAKEGILANQKIELSNSVTNLRTPNDELNDVRNTYEIKNNRIYIYDDGRYAKLNGQTLNQEYVNDKTIIKLLSKLVDEESYVELKYIPDKYIINSLNICYGNKEYKENNVDFAFEIKFYENSYYDVAFSKDNPEFMNNAFVKIRTGRMWDKNYEFENDISCSKKNLSKLESTIGIILDNSVKEEFMKYFIEKRIEAGKLPNINEPKIAEVKKIGKYTLNTFCMNDKDIEIYIEK